MPWKSNMSWLAHNRHRSLKAWADLTTANQETQEGS
jgi:hypothetical protein